MTPALACLALTLSGACAGPPEEVGDDVAEQHQAIVGGQVDTTDPAVVFVVVTYTDFTEYCSGTVIGQRVVLTAAHCFTQGTVSRVDVGFDYSYQSLPPTDLSPTNSYVVNPLYVPNTPLGGHDTAIVYLTSAAGVPALPYHAAAPDSSWVGQPVRLVGYGRTDTNVKTEGTRRAASTVIGGVEAANLTVNADKQPCFADSGSPMLMVRNGVETVVGITAAALNDCRTRGYYTRIDQDIDFINNGVAMAGSSGGGGSGGSGTGGTSMGGCSFAGDREAGSSLGMVLLALAALAVGVRRARRAA